MEALLLNGALICLALGIMVLTAVLMKKVYAGTLFPDHWMQESVVIVRTTRYRPGCEHLEEDTKMRLEIKWGWQLKVLCAALVLPLIVLAVFMALWE